MSKKETAEFLLERVMTALKAQEACEIKGAFVFVKDQDVSLTTASLRRMLAQEPKGGRYDQDNLIIVWGSALVDATKANVSVVRLRALEGRESNDGWHLETNAPDSILQAAALVLGVEWRQVRPKNPITLAREDLSRLVYETHQRGERVVIVPRSLAIATGYPDDIICANGSIIDEDVPHETH